MANVREYTDLQLLARVANLPNFKGFPKSGVLDVWVRSDEDEFDRFDDKVYSFDCFPAQEDSVIVYFFKVDFQLLNVFYFRFC